MEYLKKFLYVFSGSQKQLVFLLVVFLTTSVLEAFGIGLIGPFLELAGSPELVYKNSFFAWIYKYLGGQDVEYFILFFGLFVVIIFIVKSVLYFLGKGYTYKTLFYQRALIQSRLFSAYLSASYEFHLNRNSADFINKIVTESSRFTYLVALPLVELCSNGIVVFILVGLMATKDMILFLIALATLLPAFIGFLTLSKRIREWGQHASIAREKTLKAVSHGLGGLKETSVIGCEAYFQKQLMQSVRQEASMETRFQSTQFIPRILIETILMISIVGFVCASQLLLKRDFQSVLSVMGVFALSSMRLIPAGSQFVESLGKARNSVYTLDALYLDLKELDLNGLNSSQRKNFRIHALDFNHTLELKNIVYRYPATKSVSLNGISMTIKRGEAVGLIGASGAGKTTLVDVILGLLKPESGDILVDGQSIYGELENWRPLVGYIPQSIFLLDDTIERNIAFGVSDNSIDSERLWYAIKAAQLDKMIQDLPEGIKTSIGERGVRLSGGQRQRIGIARALYHQREILVLDEATSALDNETEQLITESIKSLSGSKTLIIIAHRLTTIEDCDRIYALEKGRIVRSGKYKEVVS
jgi:ATP-binding cassette, subfamily B, bacterial PglK